MGRSSKVDVQFHLTWTVLLLFITACAPRPDPEVPAEVARVIGECFFNLGNIQSNVPKLDSSDQRHQIIEQIVEELISARYSDFPWQVKVNVFDTPVPGAFTTGGGYLSVNSGIYAVTPDEAALAGVIAHELAHMAKFDQMELFFGYSLNFLHILLQQSGMELPETLASRQAFEKEGIEKVTDFCLLMPGLVSWNWPQDLEIEYAPANLDPEFNDQVVPYIPYTYSSDPSSPYYSATRDPAQLGRISACNDLERPVFDEFVLLSPDYYLTAYPDRASLPPIPDDVGGGTIPAGELFWQVGPWQVFQVMSFLRYAECQADEVGMLTLLASGYNPLAHNDSLRGLLNVTGNNEHLIDWRFSDHPSYGQRIEDNEWFLSNNTDVLPELEGLQDPASNYARYIIMQDDIATFETIHDEAQQAALEHYGSANAQGESHSDTLLHADPITVADLAVMLLHELSQQPSGAASLKADDQLECEAFDRVYTKLTGKYGGACSNMR